MTSKKFRGCREYSRNSILGRSMRRLTSNCSPAPLGGAYAVTWGSNPYSAKIAAAVLESTLTNAVLEPSSRM
eukprot:CAMPEP_0115719118 /NCGR_PEP_ID=MMETSP0272-20121206/77803_1 /TAXON_ID=71861 /ORGANISM="Scrippsiella trochoidea, Strain CCMP3099" /LENGTH=71 /DNA_ID=CAMNT_0003161711 /DNA_START=261 /DNA_END=476 /DNA_ORIENTATION=-